MKHWRKTYSSEFKRSRDKRLGFIVSLVINLVLIAIYFNFAKDLYTILDPSIVSLLPWVINLIIIVGALVFRPAFAIGYLYCLGAFLLIPIVLGVIVVGSCIAILGILAVLVGVKEATVNQASNSLLPTIVLCFMATLLLAIIYFGVKALFKRELKSKS